MFIGFLRLDIVNIELLLLFLGVVFLMFKRMFDVLVAGLSLILLAPIILVIALFVRVRLGAPIFFTQIRPGLNGLPFKMVKFRTMLNVLDSDGNALPDELRMTSFGRFLRSTSLDELPELWNVLRGDMSLVGPRPLLMEYLPLYTEEQSRRHEVKPGITGWAQINGRNAISWEEKFSLDVWYVENHSIFLDVKIIIFTMWKIFKREGINAKGEATMPRFSGKKMEGDE